MTSRTGSLSRPRLGWLAAGAFAGLALAVAFGPALVPPAARAVDPAVAPEHTISVNGLGRVTVVPDVADVSVGVSLTRTTVRDAQAAAATAMTAVIAALHKAGVADKDIQTTSLSLQPVYDYSVNGNAPKLTGYQIANTVQATVRDLGTISDVIDGALAAGATTLNGITFRVDDPSAAEAQARVAAMQDARAKADALARVAGRLDHRRGIDHGAVRERPGPGALLRHCRGGRQGRLHARPGRHQRGRRLGERGLPDPLNLVA